MEQPTPTNKSYSKVIEHLENGKYQIPKFQRDFVWGIKDTAKFIDSLIKGFPVGGFTFWGTTERLKTPKLLGGIRLPEAEEGEIAYYVLDGQQRLTSLLLALRGETFRKNNYKEIYIDLDKDIDSDDEICTTKETENSITFQYLMKDEDEILEDNKGDVARASKIIKMHKSVEKYQFSTIEIQGEDLTKIAEIFTRINTAGKDLDLFEIMSARIYTKDNEEGNNKGFDLEEKFDEFIKDLKQRNYETLAAHKTIILQYMSIIIERSTKRRDILAIKKERFIEEWDDAIASIKEAIDQIIMCMNIPSSGLLPYHALIIPIAYFYKKNKLKRATPAQQKLIEKYFFRAAVSYRFTSSADTKLANDIKLIDKIIKVGSKEEEHIDWSKDLEVPNISEEHFIDKLKEDFSTSLPLHKAVLCILAYNKPQNLVSNGVITLDNSWLSRSSSKNYHHFFPKGFLKDTKDIKWIEQANALANISFIDQALNIEISDTPPATYIGEFAKENTEIKEALATHCIDYDEFGIFENDYDIFLEKRATVLAKEIRDRILSDEEREKEEGSKKA